MSTIVTRASKDAALTWIEADTNFTNLNTDKVEYTSLAADNGSSLVGYLPAGTDAVATDVQSKLRDSVSVRDFGAVGDGVADDTAAISSAIAYCIANNKKLTIPYATYVFNGYSHVATNAFSVNIEGEGSGDKLPVFKASQATADAGFSMLAFPQDRYSNVTGLTLFEDTKVGQTTLKLVSTVGLSAGMCIQIASDKPWYRGARYNKEDDLPPTGKFCGEIHRINYILNNTEVILDDFVRDVYDLGGAYTISIRAWWPCSVTIKNLRLETPYPTADVVTSLSGLTIQQSVDSLVENVHVKGFTIRGFSDKLNINPRYRDIHALQDAGMYTPGSNGYGVASDGSLGLLIDGYYAMGNRRAYDADCIDNTTTEAGPARDWRVTNFTVRGGGGYNPNAIPGNTAAYSYGLGMHGGSEGGVFQNGFISSCDTGINCRGTNTTIDNVHFSGSFGRAIALYEEGAGLTVRNCTYDSFGYPDKVTDTTTLTKTGCDYFISLGINTGNGRCFHTLPIVIENNLVKGIKNGFVLMYGYVPTPEELLVNPSLVADPFVGNLYVSNNQVEVIGDGVFAPNIFSAADTLYIDHCSFANNSVKTVSGSYVLYDSTLAIGRRKDASPTVNAKIDDSYYLDMLDDTVVMIPVVEKAGFRATIIISLRSGNATIVHVTPASALHTVVANPLAYVVATATPAALTGTTGTDGNITIGLDSSGNFYLENRLGSAQRIQVQVI